VGALSSSSTSDVVVIGSGLVGACVAYELSVAGIDVTLLDAERAGRASDAGAGIASPQTFHDLDDEWYRFGRRALEHLHRLVRRLAEDGAGVGSEAFSQCGSLVVALAEHEDPFFDEVRRAVLGRDPAVSEVSADQATALFPPLARPHRALYSPDSARVDGRILAGAVRQAARRRGVTDATTAVARIERRRGDGLRVVGEGTGVDCDSVVLAAGAWSAPLAQNLGAELPVSPTKGEIVHLALGVGGPSPPDTARWPIVQPILNFYLVAWPGGRVACGGTFTPQAGYDVRPTAAGVRDLLRECLTIAPGLADAALVETRVGLRPMSPDQRPMLGPLGSAPGVHVCTGHGANGLLLGPYSAALVATAIATGHVAPELGAYSPSRFTAPSLR